MGIQDVNIDTVAEAAQQSQQSNAQAGAESTQSNEGMSREEAQAILNLDSATKFKFGDREWTPDQLRKSMMMHSDYTKKTQALAEKAKYWDNLDADIEAVRSNPELINEFIKTYPKEFHKYVSSIQGGYEAQNRQAQSQHGLPPELLKEFEQIKSYVVEQNVKAQEAQLDAKFSALEKKYPEGVEDVVLARAQALIDKGVAVTDETWEKLWKSSHEQMVKRFEGKQSGVLQKQRLANQSAKGPGPGGGAPGQAPVRMNMKQATDHAIKTLSGKG